MSLTPKALETKSDVLKRKLVAQIKGIAKEVKEKIPTPTPVAQ